MTRQVYTYIGAGQVYLRRRDTNKGLLPIADAGTLQISFEEESISQPQHTQVGGGNLDVVNRVSSMGLALTLSEVRPEQVAMAVYGEATAATTTAVVDEEHTAYEGALVMFDKAPDSGTAYVVKNQAGDTTYDVDVDYTVTQLGIIPVAGGGIADASVVTVSYTPVAADVIEMLVNSGYEYELVFEGLNEANGGRAQPVVLHRVKFGLTSSMDLITSEFANPELSGQVLVDTSIVGAGLSRYGKMWIPTV